MLGRPVESIPPGQGSARLSEIKATAAGTAAGTAVGDDLLGDMLIAAMRRHGVDTSGLVRKPDAQTSASILPIRPNGERPALHVPGATALLDRADIDLSSVAGASALMIGAPDRLGPFVTDGLPEVIAAADGALIAVDVLGPGGALVATGLGSDAGITGLEQVLGFLGGTS